VDVFIERDLRFLEQFSTKVIVNVCGKSVEDYLDVVRRLQNEAVDMLEINVSCPNVKEGGIIFGTDPTMAAKVVEAAKKRTKKPVIIKLSPNVTDIKLMAKAVENAGADAVSLINTLLGMAIDIKTKKPVLGNITGGLSGPCVKPVAIRMVYEVRGAVKLPIIGMGGIASAEDAIEFFLAGADAVAVGTANFVNPKITEEIREGLLKYLDENNYSHISEIIGLAR